MQSALAMCRRTGGALDISIYPVVRAWGFTTGSYQVPGEDAIGELLDHVDYTKIQYNDETGVVSVPDDMKIDLGSVAKGFAGSQTANICGKTAWIPHCSTWAAMFRRLAASRTALHGRLRSRTPTAVPL